MIPARHLHARKLGLATALVLISVCSSAADEPAAPSEAERSEVAARMKSLAAGLHVYPTPDRKAEASLVPEPVLRYGDSTRHNHESSLWIWESEGRPAAIVAFEDYPEGDRPGRWLYEIASLSTDRIAVERGDEISWTADEPGLTLQALAGAPVPADKPARRLSQMKELQRRFAAHERATIEGRLELRAMKPVLPYNSRTIY